MLNTDNKYLQFQCGSYGLLLNIACIVEISDYSREWCVISGSAFKHHGRKVLWHDSELLFIDMRALLNIETTAIHEPMQALILKKPTDDTPFALIVVDEVRHIADIQENQWHWLNGINTQLDSFFDRLYTDKESGQIFMRLQPAEQWANENTIKTGIANNNIGVANAY
jgi:chemotaxis signal transduction protein